MKHKELRGMGREELEKKLEELRKDLMKQNVQISTGTTPKSPGQMKVMKKTIARIISLLEQKDKENKNKEER